MNLNPFSSDFLSLGIWQGISAYASILGLVLSPLFAVLVDRVFGKKENQEHIHAYKAILLPDEGLGLGETIAFLPFQALAAYMLSILARRVLWPGPSDPTRVFVICAIVVYGVTWGLCISRRKSLAKMLILHLHVAMFLFCVWAIGFTLHKGNTAYITQDFSFIKHFVGQYLPSNVKQFPLLSSLRTISLQGIPVDLKLASPAEAKVMLIQAYFWPLVVFFIFYTLRKRHRANTVAAFVHLSEKRRKEEIDKVKFQDSLVTLDIKKVTKEEKVNDLELKKGKSGLTLRREELALEKERLLVESTRLDVEKKRAEYTLDLAIRLIETCYGTIGGADERAEALRTTLPALKDFGQPETNSTTNIIRFLQEAQAQPRIIPAAIV